MQKQGKRQGKGMNDRYEITVIQPEELLNHIHEFKENGWRLVQICCTEGKGGRFIDYSFALDEAFADIRIKVTQDTELPSISPIFFPAFLYENEMHDLYGVKINHMAIDYSGGLYRTAVKEPFKVPGKEGV
jgi:ech hydrogenase subunit D